MAIQLVPDKTRPGLVAFICFRDPVENCLCVVGDIGHPLTVCVWMVPGTVED